MVRCRQLLSLSNAPAHLLAPSFQVACSKLHGERVLGREITGRQRAGGRAATKQRGGPLVLSWRATLCAHPLPLLILPHAVEYVVNKGSLGGGGGYSGGGGGCEFLALLGPCPAVAHAALTVMVSLTHSSL